MSQPSDVSTRRTLLKRTLATTVGAIALPTFIPRTFLFGDEPPPSRRIQVAQIGCGRMGMADMGGVMASTLSRVVAVCDLDRKRLENAKLAVEKHYTAKKGESVAEVKAYHDYHEVLARPDIDAVIISTPDHWHAQIAVEAALAGKDLYVQKPLTYSIAEAIALRKVVQAKQRILQTGSQQRSESPFTSFRIASEAARNGRLGKLQRVLIGIGRDKRSGKPPVAQPVPSTFDYETWLGCAPEQPYMEGRVHPQGSLGRPGWITTEDFGLGMITNWGAHHLDIAHWGMGMELGGPTSIQGSATFMKDDLWTVHDNYHVEMQYANGVVVELDNRHENGIRFEGTDGWAFCKRSDAKVTASDGNAGDAPKVEPLRASKPSVLTDVGAQDQRWPSSPNHYADWLESILSRKAPIAPVEQSARSLEACAAAWIAMKLQRKLTWDPVTESFPGDAEANALCGRPARKPIYDIHAIMAKAGIS